MAENEGKFVFTGKLVKKCLEYYTYPPGTLDEEADEYIEVHFRPYCLLVPNEDVDAFDIDHRIAAKFPEGATLRIEVTVVPKEDK